MPVDEKHPLGQALHRDLEQTKADLNRGKGALHRDLEQTKADLNRGKGALHRDLEQTKAHLTGGRSGADLNQHVGDTLRQVAGAAPVLPDAVPNPVEPEPDRSPTIRTPHCPECQAELGLAQGAWVCPSGHGHATVLPIAARQIGDTAVHELWAAAGTAVASGRPCPFCEEPMAVIDLAWDETELSSLLTPGDPIRGRTRLAVCRPDTLIWFDRDQLAALPPQPQSLV